mgnify:CR=1 FL=1
MKPEKLDPKEELANLKKEFGVRLVQAERELDEGWKEVLRSEWAEDAMRDLIQRAHHLAGAGGTFGYLSVSQRGRELETVLRALEGTRPDLSRSSEIGAMVERLRKACLSEARGSGGGSRRYQTEVLRPSLASSRPGPVFIIETDPTVSRQLVLQIASFGYTVRTFPSLTGVAEAALLSDPCAIVVDSSFLGGPDEGETLLSQVQAGRAEPVPILYLSTQSDLPSRLRAVRAWGRAYFTKPVDYDHLVEVLQGLTTRENAEPFRILIVEDDRQVATFCARVLEEAGMIPSAVTNPMSALQMLAAFRPELILMDLYMPDCSGIELATVIRQQGAYDGIPIVYLSGETDVDRQLAAMRLGGDDFLTKPILPEHLIASIVARAQRSRTLRSYMVKDGLTGLSNHSIGMQQLDVAIMQSRARRTRLGYALIDLDHFRSVNDVYGHPAGDRVLRNLALLLRRRLRKHDMVCRFGGEEFAVILPETDGLDVVKILDEIRSDFSEVHHRSNGDEFATTFSAGVATAPPHGDVVAITDAARSALYEAKQNGRNRLVMV